MSTDRSNFHYIATAAMLPQKLGGVVDSNLTVYGTSNVRVVDASVVPLQVCGHLASTLYAIAEKASDMIREDAGPRSATPAPSTARATLRAGA